jgi:phosphomannomutase
MQDHIFRAYDIRGIVGSELLIENVYDFARALTFYCIEKNSSVKRIAVGMDGRSHSLALKDELIRGFTDSGLDIVFIGRCPTPALYYSQHHLPVQAGVMITASHNPADYNGFKMVLNKQSIAKDEIKKLRTYFKQKKTVEIKCFGKIDTIPIVPDYVAYLKEQFPHLVRSDVSVVFDCAKGAAATVIPKLIKAFEWKNATAIHTTIDGTFSCDEPDPSVAKNMELLKAAQLKQGALLGIGFDGDADRMCALDQTGQLVSGDKLLGVFAHQVLQERPGATIVFDAKCSDALTQWIEQWGGIASVAKTGHSFIKEALQKTGALLAGELSCHFFFKDRYFGFDDGIYAALRLIEILEQSKKSLGTLLEQFPHRVASPELRIDCPLHKGPEIVAAARRYFEQEKKGIISTLDGVKVTKEYGWGLLRSSNTQSVVCLRLEAHCQEGLAKIRQDFIESLCSSFERTFLEKTVTW